MTKQVYLTNLKEITKLRIVCTKCKAEMIIPIKAQEEPPIEKCFSCKTELPWNEIRRAVNGIAEINKAAADYKKIEAYFETDEDSGEE